MALLDGVRPRTEGMEREDLLRANAGTFAPHARASNAGADDHVRALVVGNAADTDALIAQAAAPGRAGRPIDHDDRRGHTTA